MQVEFVSVTRGTVPPPGWEAGRGWGGSTPILRATSFSRTDTLRLLRVHPPPDRVVHVAFTVRALRATQPAQYTAILSSYLCAAVLYRAGSGTIPPPSSLSAVVDLYVAAYVLFVLHFFEQIRRDVVVNRPH